MQVRFSRLDDNSQGNWDIGNQPFVLGRGDPCQVVLNDLTSEGVSGRHLQLVSSNSELFVEDLGSTNGTFVNGSPVSARTAVKLGDVFSCGKKGPRFRIDGIQVPSAAIANNIAQPKAFEFNHAQPAGVSAQPSDVKSPLAGKSPVNPLGKSKAARSEDASSPRLGTRELVLQVMKKQSTSWRLVLAVLGAVGISLAAIYSVIPKQEAGGKEAYDRLLKCSLWILPGNGTMGSGVVVEYKGELFGLTNYHVVETIPTVTVYLPEYRNDELMKVSSDIERYGTKIDADVLESISIKDVAVMRLRVVPNDCVPLKLTAHSPDSGDTLYTLGNPGATRQTRWIFSRGEVRSVDENTAMFADDAGGLKQVVKARMIINTLPINGGDSGGPLINSQFELVGLNSCGRDSAKLVSYGIDVTEIRKILDDVIAKQ